MEGPLMFARVLVANRGEIARRLIRQLKEAGIETVSVFSEPDVEQPYVEEADYSVYLNGKTVAETYLDSSRIVGAAMDAGCDAIHPGYCFLAERPDFVHEANLANLAVIGADKRALTRAGDRFDLRRVARDLGIPIIPASDPLRPGDDGVAAAAQIGFPLYVKTPAGGVIRRVETMADLPAAVALVRELATVVTGEPTVYLERAVDRMRRCGTVVAADQHDTIVHIGLTDASMMWDYHTWIEELGEALVGHELHEKLGAKAVELTRAIGWTGLGRVRWAITPDRGWYMLGFSGRLTTGYSLVEQVVGTDLVQTQLRLAEGEPLGWKQEAVKFPRHGVELRLFPFDAENPGVAPTGTIERMTLPTGEHLLTQAGTAEGQPVTADTDPLLAKITVTGPTRHAALVRARAALEEVVIEGVATNRDVLLRLLADEAVWRGEYDDNTVARLLDAGAVGK